MKFMKLGSKPDTFQTDGNNVRYVASELASDIAINVGDVKFYLHKFPLLSKSATLQKLVSNASEGNSDEVDIHDIPGGPSAFEICAKFCYGMTVTLNAYNVISTRCAAEYLGMNESLEKGNLIYKIDVFLNSSIFRSWKDSIIVLQTTKSQSRMCEELKLTSHCIDAVASRASVDVSRVDWSYTYNRKKLSEENGNDPNLNGIRSRMVPKDWWVEDLCELEVDLYKRVVITIKNKGIVSSEAIGEAAKAYAYRRFPGFNKGAFQFNDVSKCRPILDTVVWLLPSEKGCVSCSFLLKLLKASISLDSGETVKAELVKRIGQQLEESSVNDLLIRAADGKKGHVCNFPKNLNPIDNPSPNPNSSLLASPPSVVRPQPPPPLPQRHVLPQLRRALSFDDVDVNDSPGSDDEGDFSDLDNESDRVGAGSGIGTLPSSCLWEVFKRLPPPALLSSARVCKGWLESSRRIWKSAVELRLRVPVNAQIGLVGSVLKKCPGLVKLSLRMESDIDATMLACIAFSCPKLDSMEILMCNTSVNRITGDELGRFVAEKRSLTNLKMEGCSNLGGFTLCSTSLSTLSLSDLYCHAKMVFNCPNLKDVSLDFSHQENDTTDLTLMVDGLGRSCPRLQNIHIASIRLTHAVVLALTAANLRGLRMLSLVLGSEITDASVAAIASSYSNLELLDLSGSSISDSGIGMICNIFPETLSKLLLALCPNITSSGIQFAAAQLPNLELMDCGMTISDPDLDNPTSQENNDLQLQRTPNSKQHLIYQKLIIKHTCLKKLSLWGCSGLDALYLNCPELKDLNLNSCTNLNPERLLLQCPNLEYVHALGCQDALVGTLKNQVCADFMGVEDHSHCKRLPDGSKRIKVPDLFSPQPTDKKTKRISKRCCTVLVN